MPSFNDPRFAAAYQRALTFLPRRDAQGLVTGRPDLTGIDIGNRYRNGVRLNEVALRVHVRTKLEGGVLGALDLMHSLLGVDVDVIEAAFSPHGGGPMNNQLGSRRTRANPVRPGVSISHVRALSGTFGAVVYREDGQQCVLSARHVLAGFDNPKAKDAIVQPGRVEHGHDPSDTIAHLVDWLANDPNEDAAIAALTEAGRTWIPELWNTNIVIGGPRDPRLGDVLAKSGAMTDVTYGRVDGIGQYVIDFGDGAVVVEGFRIVPDTAAGTEREEISFAGDSGAVWYDPATNEGVGLHIAGEGTDELGEHAIACQLPRILAKLNASLTPPAAPVRPHRPGSISGPITQSALPQPTRKYKGSVPRGRRK